jgi:hypothetical protein
MTEAQKTAEKMRRISLKEQKSLATSDQISTPANYLPPSVINSISSVKKDKSTFEKLISRELIDMIMNGETQTIKLKAMDMYHKMSSSSQLLIKNGNKTAAIDAPSEQGGTINVNFSSHVQTDEPAEEMKVAHRDLVAEKNAAIFEDADFEVIDE